MDTNPAKDIVSGVYLHHIRWILYVITILITLISQINNKARPLGHLHYGLKCTRPSRVDDNFSAGTSLPTGKASSFGMLMKNIDVLEETFAESGMLSLGRDGQNDLAIEDGGYHNVHPKTDGQNDDVVVYSGKRAGRRSVKKRAVDNADKVASQPLTTRAAKEKFRNSSIFSRKRAFKRPTVARNEVEISTGVKVDSSLICSQSSFQYLLC